MSFFVYGGRALRGEIVAQGAKNAALPILFATLLAKEAVTLYGVPCIGDVQSALSILREMGVAVLEEKEGGITLLSDKASPPTPMLGAVTRIRASAYLLGASLARFGEGHIAYPGGCAFGNRPLDYHREGLSRLGALWEENENGVCVRWGKPRAASYVLPYPSVGATVNYILAALGVDGESTLGGYAKEHHVFDFIAFLRKMGAEIYADGELLHIKGGTGLRGGEYTVCPDAMEAGTYLIAAAVTGGEVTVRRVRYAELSPLLLAFGEMNIPFRFCGDAVTVYPPQSMRGIHITASPYPGFPTDLHPPMTVLLSRARGGGSICDLVWQDRFSYIGELRKMGASLLRSEHAVRIFEGRLHGASVKAPDLRGGAALLLAALAAEGKSRIDGADVVARGYEAITQKLFSLGAEITCYPPL